jgi:hypothetical protein
MNPATVSPGKRVNLAKPKSSRRTPPFFNKNTLAGLISRWTIPWAWARSSVSTMG